MFMQLTSSFEIDITCALLVAWSYLPNDSSYVKGLATSEKFLGAVSKYLGNLDPAMRLMGMAVAEEVAKLSGRKLEFGDWEGEKDGRTWIRQLRELIKARDADVVDAPPEMEEAEAASPSAQLPMLPTRRKSHGEQVGAQRDDNGTRSITHPRSREPDSDDDSLVGYGSEPCPSRAPSPTPSELNEIEKDPTLRTGGGLKKGKKLVRPVYLVSLGELFRPSAAEGEEEVRKVEMALTYGEELIRRKRDFGTELGIWMF
jgi:telomere length regulation protein